MRDVLVEALRERGLDTTGDPIDQYMQLVNSLKPLYPVNTDVESLPVDVLATVSLSDGPFASH